MGYTDMCTLYSRFVYDFACFPDSGSSRLRDRLRSSVVVTCWVAVFAVFRRVASLLLSTTTTTNTIILQSYSEAILPHAFVLGEGQGQEEAGL